MKCRVFGLSSNKVIRPNRSRIIPWSFLAIYLIIFAIEIAEKCQNIGLGFLLPSGIGSMSRTQFFQKYHDKLELAFVSGSAWRFCSNVSGRFLEISDLQFSLRKDVGVQYQAIPIEPTLKNQRKIIGNM